MYFWAEIYTHPFVYLLVNMSCGMNGKYLTFPHICKLAVFTGQSSILRSPQRYKITFFPHRYFQGNVPLEMEMVVPLSGCGLDTNKLIAVSGAERKSCKGFLGVLVCSRLEEVRLSCQWRARSLISSATTCFPRAVDLTCTNPCLLSSMAVPEFSF